MKTNEQILKQMRVRNTLLCCGLDPDLRKLPPEIIKKNISDDEKVLAFLRGVVDVTAPHVCVFKAQKAFFDVLTSGHDVLKKLIEYIHTSNPGIPVIVDCKIGDIENTMEVYIQNLFGLLQADGIVVNPYMGDDVMLPLVELTDKSIVVLVKTSNPSGGIIQDMVLQDGHPLWWHVLNHVINRWDHSKNMIPVLSSTVGFNMEELRAIIPDKMPILLAGVGAQGGSYANLSKLLNREGIGVFVNSSRSILYPQQSRQSWQNAVEEVAIEMKECINRERERG